MRTCVHVGEEQRGGKDKVTECVSRRRFLQEVRIIATFDFRFSASQEHARRLTIKMGIGRKLKRALCTKDRDVFGDHYLFIFIFVRRHTHTHTHTIAEWPPGFHNKVC